MFLGFSWILQTGFGDWILDFPKLDFQRAPILQIEEKKNWVSVLPLELNWIFVVLMLKTCGATFSRLKGF